MNTFLVFHHRKLQSAHASVRQTTVVPKSGTRTYFCGCLLSWMIAIVSVIASHHVICMHVVVGKLPVVLIKAGQIYWYSNLGANDLVGSITRKTGST